MLFSDKNHCPANNKDEMIKNKTSPVNINLEFFITRKNTNFY